MIIDAHTHIFPRDVRDRPEEYAARDPGFRDLYATPGTPIATAEELLASMDEAGIDRAVALGFAWQDAELCRMHTDELLAAGEASGGRIIPFGTVHPSDDGARKEMERIAARGGRGLGELRPEQQGYRLIDTEEADLLAWAADAYDLPLLFHADEPVGPPRPGKAGGSLEQIGRFIADFPGATVVVAHWGGGLPFYALLPEVRDAMSDVYFDSAVGGARYDARAYRAVVDLVGEGRVLFGSNFPKLPQREALEEARAAGLSEDALDRVLGENARRLLRLPAQ